jgi:hypothetical protein
LISDKLLNFSAAIKGSLISNFDIAITHNGDGLKLVAPLLIKDSEVDVNRQAEQTNFLICLH